MKLSTDTKLYDLAPGYIYYPLKDIIYKLTKGENGVHIHEDGNKRKWSRPMDYELGDFFIFHPDLCHGETLERLRENRIISRIISLEDRFKARSKNAL